MTIEYGFAEVGGNSEQRRDQFTRALKDLNAKIGDGKLSGSVSAYKDESGLYLIANVEPVEKTETKKGGK